MPYAMIFQLGTKSGLKVRGAVGLLVFASEHLPRGGKGHPGNRPVDGFVPERAEPRGRGRVIWFAEGRARTEGWAWSARPVGVVRALPGGAAGRCG